ncbi:MAG: hypothetical protein RMI91_13010 [Gemmatales bacterium]|nr:DUF4198 domain-containing protein [Gemmatales bacterium]MDW7995563.1 hypothetical protein [Gemmatales bacterium]
MLSGCKKGPPLVEVSGQLLFQGRPAELVLVNFCSTQVEQRVQCYPATTDPTGRFTLRCPPGEYKVTLMPLQMGVWDEGSALVYQPLASTSGLSDGSDTQQQKPPPKYLLSGPPIPEQYRVYRQTPLKVTVPDQGIADLTLQAD